jgi:hypothetical protein
MAIETVMTKTATSASSSEKRSEPQSHNRWAQFALKSSIYVIDVAGIVAILAVMTWLFSRQSSQLLSVAAIAVLVAVGIGLYPVSYRRGQSTIGIRIFLVSFLLLLAISTPLMPAIMLTAVLGYTIIFIQGNLLAGEKSPYWLIGACLFAFVADVLLVRNVAPGLSPVPDETVRLVGVASFGSLILLTIGIIVRIAILAQEEKLYESQLVQGAEKQRAAAEQEQRERLRSTVQKYVEHVERVASGDLSARLTLAGNGHGTDDPLGVLGQRLNEMTASLQRTITQVREQRGDLRTIVGQYVAYMADVARDNPLVVPFIADGQFYGVAGVDLDLECLQKLADEMNIYDGSGKLVLRSSHGTLVRVTDQPDLIGKGGPV